MPQASKPDKSGQVLQVVQFTDTHFFGTADGRLMGVDTAITFEQVERLAAQQRGVPDFYLLTGDISQDESRHSYQRFAQAVEHWRAPAFYIPGNHDVQALMKQSFASVATDNATADPGTAAAATMADGAAAIARNVPFRSQNTFIAGNWQLVLLDTHVEGRVSGHLSDAELDRLKQALSACPDKHALIVMHHHPIACGASWLDGIGVDNGADFMRILDDYEQARGVLFGHIHQEFETMRNGVRYMGTPSTCVQFKPRTIKFAADPIPPGYRWLELAADGTIYSQVVRLASVAAGLDLASAGY